MVLYAIWTVIPTSTLSFESTSGFWFSWLNDESVWWDDDFAVFFGNEQSGLYVRWLEYSPRWQRN